MEMFPFFLSFSKKRKEKVEEERRKTFLMRKFLNMHDENDKLTTLFA
jgi:hypothetical protein